MFIVNNVNFIYYGMYIYINIYNVYLLFSSFEIAYFRSFSTILKNIYCYIVLIVL